MDKMTLTEIAKKINAHIERFQADPKINTRDGHGSREYYNAGAWRAGRYVKVVKVSYQGGDTLTRDEAIDYLGWLDAGNVGMPLVMRWLRQKAIEKVVEGMRSSDLEVTVDTVTDLAECSRDDARVVLMRMHYSLRAIDPDFHAEITS